MTLPDGGAVPPRPWDDTPTPIQSALARGHRWLAMVESGEARTLSEVAEREGMDRAYVSRMVNLTTLAPDIVTAILDETLPRGGDPVRPGVGDAVVVGEVAEACPHDRVFNIR